MSHVELELDSKWYTVLASSNKAVLVKHNVTGGTGIFRLDWRNTDNYPQGFEGEAWAKYMDVSK